MQEEKASVSQSLWSKQISQAHANFKSGKTGRKHDEKFPFLQARKKSPTATPGVGYEVSLCSQGGCFACCFALLISAGVWGLWLPMRLTLFGRFYTLLALVRQYSGLPLLALLELRF